MLSIEPMPSSKGDANRDSASREESIDRPLEYLLTSSEASIESFHLSRLNSVANLRKELLEIFEEWVEAEVQARLARWLLARKNSETLATAGSVTIDSGTVDSGAIGSSKNRNAQIAATHSPSNTATHLTAAANFATNSSIAGLNSASSDDSNPSPIESRIPSRSVGTNNRAARTASSKLTSRPRTTRSPTVGRTPRFPPFVPLRATRESTMSKSRKATTTLLSFRPSNRNSRAL